MLRNNDQRDTGITPDEVLDALKRLGRPHFNKRLLTHFSNEAIGLLPKLRRTSRPGSNKPIYVWDENVLKQIIELYDLTQHGCRDYHDRLFSLWIRGYEVPFQRAQQTILQFIESQIQDFTQGEEDHEETLYQISTVVATRLLPKWKYSPKPESKIRRLDLDAYARSVERFLDLVLVPTHKQDEFDAAQDWQRVFQEVLSLPRLRDAAMNATMEEWQQARADYMRLSIIICPICEPLTRCAPIHSWILTGTLVGLLEILYAMVIKGALFLLLPFLSLRQHGHGIWIDKAFTKAQEILNNQEVFTYLFLTAAERMTEITGDYNWLGPAIVWANEQLFEASDFEIEERYPSSEKPCT
jgi:hypothetical protein